MKKKFIIIAAFLLIVSSILILNNSYSTKNTSEETISLNNKNTIKKVNEYYNEEFWEYRYLIETITFENNITPIDNAKSWDISANNDQSVIAYLVKKDNEKYDLYIKSDNEIYTNENSSYLFYDFTNLTKINNIEYLNTSKTTDMSYMFANCNNLITLELNTLDTKNVTNSSHMFESCINLTYLEIDQINTESLEDISYMFFECNNLKELELNWNTNNITNMSHLFQYDSKLEKINLSSWNTEKVTDTSYMFNNCESLTNLDLKNFNTTNVTTAKSMFANCINLEKLENNFDLSNTKELGNINETTNEGLKTYGMFYNTPKLSTTINITNPYSEYYYMFEKSAQTYNSKIILNYSSNTENIINKLISNNKNIIKGSIINE